MITKDGQPIKRYQPIDHCAEGVKCTMPKGGERLIGRLVDRREYEDVFIEHVIAGRTVETMNARDVSWIEFEEEHYADEA